MLNFIIMKNLWLRCLLAIGLMLPVKFALAQCDIKNRLEPDGSMMYYIEPVNFYWTQDKDLKGGIVTDKEHYFLALQPSPVPDKSEGKKLKSDVELKLSNDTAYTLNHYDTRYIENDSVIEMLYLIKNDDLKLLKKYEVIEARLDMGEEGTRSYVFKLHKEALKEQLNCFLAEEGTRQN